MNEFKKTIRSVIMITGVMFFSHFCVWIYAYSQGALVINGSDAGLLDLIKGLSISLLICIGSASLLDFLMQAYAFIRNRIP